MAVKIEVEALQSRRNKIKVARLENEQDESCSQSHEVTMSDRSKSRLKSMGLSSMGLMKMKSHNEDEERRRGQTEINDIVSQQRTKLQQTLGFIFLFIGVGAILFVISCFGCIGAATRNGCCLTCYAVLVILLILVELACAAFLFFDKSWKEEIPTDKTGDFDMIYEFLKDNWEIVKWVALGVVILEALLFLLTLIVRAANRPVEYDSDDEYIGGPRQQIRQPLINRPPAPATGVPVAGTLDQRPGRSDAWSARMREKYGLDTSEFTYNPSESNRVPQTAAQPTEEKSRCTIM